MIYKNIALIITTIIAITFICSCNNSYQKKNNKTNWLREWEKNNNTWKGMHFSPLEEKEFDSLKKFITNVMVPKGLNALVLEINYSFKFTSHPELAGTGFNKFQARQLTELCHQNNIRLIPLFNCIGHQSDGGKNTFALLQKYPKFDETPYVSADNNGIYCREWCPSNPDVYPIVFDLIDEIIDAFQADAIHVGMDEIFLLGDPNCQYCKGGDNAKIFADAVNRFHRHIVDEKGIEMHMWGDRLLKASMHSYEGEKEVSKTGTDVAIDMIPKDIVIYDWHYWLRPQFTSVQHFVDKGFRVWPTTWMQATGSVAFWQTAQKCDSKKVLGMLFTSWCISSPDQLIDVINNDTEKYKNTGNEHRIPYAESILETINTTLAEIDKSPH
ncbi:MAG TPA: family 20 glycosylhydrolase [Sedimentisphaerales bacterium]|nr:family 20 glycosylhydrolase [Sedimentisphaerales bacterium]